MTPNRRPRDSFAIRLVIMRTELGLSQGEAAERCGLSGPTWSTWERGARPRGMDRVVQQIAKGLGYDRGWIMFGGPLNEGGPDGPDGGSDQGITGSGCIADSRGKVLRFDPSRRSIEQAEPPADLPGRRTA